MWTDKKKSDVLRFPNGRRVCDWGAESNKRTCKDIREDIFFNLVLLMACVIGSDVRELNSTKMITNFTGQRRVRARLIFSLVPKFSPPWLNSRSRKYLEEDEEAAHHCCTRQYQKNKHLNFLAYRRRKRGNDLLLFSVKEPHEERSKEQGPHRTQLTQRRYKKIC